MILRIDTKERALDIWNKIKGRWDCVNLTRDPDAIW